MRNRENKRGFKGENGREVIIKGGREYERKRLKVCVCVCVQKKKVSMFLLGQ